jgi:hypothetical protein
MGEREKATVSVKFTPSEHREIRILAAELGMRNHEAVAYAVRRALEEVRRKRSEGE